MITFRLFNKKELEAYIQSGEYKKMRIVPITEHRAISHINNPRTGESDILLILALRDDRLIGYLGILPDLMFPDDGIAIKFGWLSCFWVEPDERGKGIGKQLLVKSLEVWNNRIISADYVPSTLKIYEKTNCFSDPFVKTGIRLYFRMDLHTILPPRNNFFARISGILKAFDYAFNALFDVRFLFHNHDSYKFNFKYCDQIDNEIETFITQFQNTQLFKRGLKELSWIIDFPWIKTSLSGINSTQIYHFSSIDHFFNYSKIKLYNAKGQFVAFLLLSRRNDMLKLLYYYASNDMVETVVKILEFHIIKWKITTFTIFNPEIVKYLTQHHTAGLYKKKIQKKYLISKPLSEMLIGKEFEIQDGDGDLAFT